VTTVLFHGCGVVGSHAARQLATVPGVSSIVIDDAESTQAALLVTSAGLVSVLGSRTWDDVQPDIVVLASPAGHVGAASQALRLGAHVVSVSDDVTDVEALLSLGPLAVAEDRRVVLGAGFAPGLTCILARHAGAEFSRIDDVQVAKTGTAGPACARQHHAALSSDSRDWRDGRWERFPGGSGRELCWFPEPIGGVDCYRGALVDPLLLQPSFPDAQRITSRVGATRRDRATARLPMMRQPHAEAGPGAVRVEVRGMRNGGIDSVVFGCYARASSASGSVTSVMVEELMGGRCVGPHVAGLSSQVGNTATVLTALAARGIQCVRFEGTAVGTR
jgi:hypothetical protein